MIDKLQEYFETLLERSVDEFYREFRHLSGKRSSRDNYDRIYLSLVFALFIDTLAKAEIIESSFDTRVQGIASVLATLAARDRQRVMDKFMEIDGVQ